MCDCKKRRSQSCDRLFIRLYSICDSVADGRRNNETLRDVTVNGRDSARPIRGVLAAQSRPFTVTSQSRKTRWSHITRTVKLGTGTRGNTTVMSHSPLFAATTDRIISCSTRREKYDIIMSHSPPVPDGIISCSARRGVWLFSWVCRDKTLQRRLC